MVLKAILVLALIIAVYFDVKYFNLVSWIAKYKTDIEYRNSNAENQLLHDREIVIRIYGKFDEYVRENSENDQIDDALFKLHMDFAEMINTLDKDCNLVLDNNKRINEHIKHLSSCVNNKN